MKKAFLTTMIFALILTAFIDSSAQQGVKITRWVIGSGGMIMQKNAENIEMSGVTGQLAIEKISGSSDGKTVDVFQGFWVPADRSGDKVEESASIEKLYNLSNYPNPFSSQTTIRYELDAASNITLQVYDVLGNKIKELYSGKQETGAHEVSWDIKSSAGFELSSGSYILELKSQPIGSGKTFIARNIMIASK